MKKEVRKIAKWIQKYVESARTDGVVIGLSGGIDSSTSAALAVKALGNMKVIGITMPCKSNKKDREDGEAVAKLLGIECLNIDLEKPLKAMLKVRDKAGKGKLSTSDLTIPNMKARLRMITLYSIANDLNYLVIGTGNKSEYEIGYFTKWGDGAVDFEPLGDFYKIEVLDLALALGLPSKLVFRTPSAGLWEGQTDEDEIGVSYPSLDSYLKTKKTKHLSNLQLIKIQKLMKAAKHKQNMPPLYKR